MLEYLERATAKHPKVAEARAYAREGQESIDQRRKGSGEPYNVHTEGVADIVASLVDDPEMVMAALNHDDLEDIPGRTMEALAVRFGLRVAHLVLEVTDLYTSDRYPDLFRKVRKQLEAERLSGISPDGKLIKLADIVHNTLNPENRDEAFGKVWVAETRALLPRLLVNGSSPHESLHARARSNLGIGETSFRPLNIPRVPARLGLHP